VPSPTPTPDDRGLRSPDGRDVVYLVDAASDLEVRILERWIRRQTGARGDTIRIDSSRRGEGGQNDALATRLAAGDDPHLIPVRVVWMAPETHGRRSVGWSDVFKPGDPRDPRGLRARWIRLTHPGRVIPVAGRGATASEMVEAHRRGEEVDGLIPFVTRRAWLALDQEERHLRGNRYKVPRFVHEAILSRRSFVEAVDALAADEGLDPEATRERATRYLHEIAATHSPYVIDLVANAIHTLYRQGYGRIQYDPDQVTAIAELGQSNPIVFLPSHRSNLDRLSLQFLLWENDLPPNHTAGGINLDFFPVGPLMRRTGVFFIRRSFKGDQLYKLVLQSYLDYLIEKRFSLEWYLEGGRSRTGRLQPPRFGLLQYVVDSYRRGKADDIMLVPVSIAYDQIQDVADYTREAQGRDKEKESIGWLVRAVRSLRRRYGDIYIRFGRPVSVSGAAGELSGGDEPNLALQKLAFEVMHRIAGVTPVTPTAVVSIVLLAAGSKARSPEEIGPDCADLVAFIRSRGIEMTDQADLADVAVVGAVLDWLAEHRQVSRHEALDRAVYWLEDDQMIHLSYYRNVVLHYFVPRAVAEISLRWGAETGAGGEEALVGSMLSLRDLLKFEFYFADRDRFVEQVFDDIERDVPGWRDTLAASGPESVIGKLGEPMARWALLPILDAYQVVGDELDSMAGPFEEKPFLKACLARARMYRIEGRAITGESASQVVFKSALALAANRGLLTEGSGPERSRFAEEVREVRRLAAAGA
jgi:glycerol-3-phosphate O-acyltransferase